MKQKVYKLTFCLALGLCSFLNAQENRVGINTDSPKATLDVNGNMAIRSLETKDESKIDPLYWDVKSKEIVRGTQKSFAKKSFYVVNLLLQGHYEWGNDGRWKADIIKNFDTKIDANKYIVIVTAANPSGVQGDKENDYAPKHTLLRGTGSWEKSEFKNVKQYVNREDSDPSSGDNARLEAELNPTIEKAAFVEGGTWRLKADYVLSRPNSYGAFHKSRPVLWAFQILVIDKAYGSIVDFTDQSVDDDADGTMSDNNINLN